MMSLESPCPGSRCLRLTEQGEVVEFWIAHRTPALFDLLKNRFEAHDGRHLQESLLRQTGAEQNVRQLPLRGVEVLDRDPLAWHRRVEPVLSLLVVKRKGRP